MMTKVSGQLAMESQAMLTCNLSIPDLTHWVLNTNVHPLSAPSRERSPWVHHEYAAVLRQHETYNHLVQHVSSIIQVQSHLLCQRLLPLQQYQPLCSHTMVWQQESKDLEYIKGISNTVDALILLECASATVGTLSTWLAECEVARNTLLPSIVSVTGTVTPLQRQHLSLEVKLRRINSMRPMVLRRLQV
jgi:hypothetical protein